MDKREMVDEYFSMSINGDGMVETIPLLLKGYTPNLDHLPHFLLCLGTEVGPPLRVIINAIARSIGRMRRNAFTRF